jgi:chromosome segregation ATPase
VQLIYKTATGQEVVFSRHIQPSSGAAQNMTFQSVYRINGRHVSWDAYSQQLSTHGIHVKIRNFLVFQVGVAIGNAL